MTYFDLNIDKYKKKVFAYIIKGLRYPVILEKPWLKHEKVIYTAYKHRLSIGRAGDILVYKKRYRSESLKTKAARNIFAISAISFAAKIKK